MIAIDHCEWNAGHDRYTGSVASAVASYRFPIATQAALIEAWEKRSFADTVVIDRDSIRGRASDYAPAIRDMHFGAAGKTCATVTRATWTPDHTETGVVICAGAECLLIPAVCLNVSRITRLEAPATAALADFGPAIVAPIPLFPLPDEATGAGPIPVFTITPDSDGEGSSFASVPAPVFGGEVVGCCELAAIAPVAPVAEPQMWTLILAGLAALFVWRRGAPKKDTR